jgi:hypothetical protein
MKVLSLFLILFTFSVHAQLSMNDIMNAKDKKKETATTTTSSGVQTSEVTTTEAKTVVCENKESKYQKFIPRAIVQMLFEDPASGSFSKEQISKNTKVKITTSPMIQNCKDMMGWGFGKIDDKSEYLFEAKVKDGSDCVDKDNKGHKVCKYEVTVVENNDYTTKTYEFENNVRGFISCLEKTGVFKKDGGQSVRDLDLADMSPVPNLVFDAPETGDVKFRTSRYAMQGVKPLYDDNAEVVGCDIFEDIEDVQMTLLSYDDMQRQEAEEAIRSKYEKLCKNRDYEGLLSKENKEQFDQIVSDTDDIVKKLASSDYEKFVARIRNKRADDDLSDVDFSIISSYKQYVVDPHLDAMGALSNEIAVMEDGEEKDAKVEELRKMETELKKMVQGKNFTQGDVDRLQLVGSKAAFDMALEIKRVLNRAEFYTADNLLKHKPSTLDEKIATKNNEAYYFVTEKKNEIDRKKGLRPQDAAMAQQEAHYERQRFQQMQQEQQMVEYQAYEAIKRECPWAFNGYDPSTQFCDAYELYQVLKEEGVKQLEEQKAKITKLEQNAKIYQEQHNAAMQAQGKNTENLSAMERYQQRRERYNSYNLNVSSGNKNYNAYLNSNSYWNRNPYQTRPDYYSSYPYYGGYNQGYADPYQGMYNRHGGGNNLGLQFGINATGYRTPAGGGAYPYHGGSYQFPPSAPFY